MMTWEHACIGYIAYTVHLARVVYTCIYAKYFIMSKMLLYHAVCVVQRSLNIFMHCMHHVVASELAVQSAIYCSEKIKWPLAPKNWAFIKPLFEAYCYQFLLCDESYMEGEIPSLQPLYCNLPGVWPMACNSLQKSFKFNWP